MDLLNNVLGFGRKIKQYVKKRSNDEFDTLNKQVVQPIKSFGIKSNNIVQKTGNAIGNKGIDYLFKKPTQVASRIGALGAPAITKPVKVAQKSWSESFFNKNSAQGRAATIKRASLSKPASLNVREILKPKETNIGDSPIVRAIKDRSIKPLTSSFFTKEGLKSAVRGAGNSISDPMNTIGATSELSTFGSKVLKEIAASKSAKFIASALKGMVKDDIIPALSKKLSTVSKANEVKTIITEAKNSKPLAEILSKKPDGFRNSLARNNAEKRELAEKNKPVVNVGTSNHVSYDDFIKSAQKSDTKITDAPVLKRGEKTYKMMTNTGVSEIVGKPVKIVDGVETFVRKENGVWVVSEASSGRYLADGNTIKEAVFESKRRIDGVGEEGFKKLIAENQLPQPKEITPKAPLEKEGGQKIYHGTDADFDKYNPDANPKDFGTYFGTDKDYIKSYGKKNLKEESLKPGIKLSTEEELDTLLSTKAYRDLDYKEAIEKSGVRGVKYDDGSIQLFYPNEDIMPKMSQPKEISPKSPPMQEEGQIITKTSPSEITNSDSILNEDHFSTIRNIASQKGLNNADQLIEIYSASEKIKPEIDNLAQQVAEAVNGRVLTAPLKGFKDGGVFDPARALEKFTNDGVIKDIARNTIEVDNVEDAQSAVDMLRKNGGIVYEDRKNYFKAPTELGYRGVNLNFKDANGVMAEIQINIPEIMEVKNGVGHKIYEAVREIQKRVREDGRAFVDENGIEDFNYNKIERPQVDALTKQSKEAYNQAIEKARIRSAQADSRANLDSTEALRLAGNSSNETLDPLSRKSANSSPGLEINTDIPPSLLGIDAANAPSSSKNLGSIDLNDKQLTSKVYHNPSERSTPQMANLGINTNHLNIGDEGKGIINQTMGELKPTLENTVGKVMGKEEVEKAAEATAQTLKRTLSREEVLEIGARAQNLRQEIAVLAEKGTITPELIDALKRDKEFSSGTARLLQQRSIDVDPIEKSPMLQMVELVNSKVDDLDAILEAAKGVDFNDANQSAVFYRQFIKPKVGDWLDLLRYNSMLTSPLTHIVNISSNLVNSGAIAPLEKTVAGGIDFFGSMVTGKDRSQFAGEGLQHLGGYAKSVGEATQRFADVMTGKVAQTNLDTRHIPLMPGSKVEGALSFPLRLLEGMDQFFTVLTEGGERASLNYRQAKGVKVNNLEGQVADKAAYRIYRQDLHADDQGGLLDAIDHVTGMVMKARNSENAIVRNVAKWTIPFIKTPTNIFKQGLEYSPVGFGTVIGAKNKTDQLAKAVIGSAVFSGAAMLLGSDRLTWAMPIGQKEKDAFLAAGKQPYSVKIGDKYFSYQKLPPGLSFSLALVAAIDDTQKTSKLSDDTVDQILTAVAKYGQFLSDQSYAKNMGDLLTAAKGGESGITRLLSNYPQQMVPYRALGGWLARMVDDTQRTIDPKLGFIDKQVQLLIQNIPGLRDNTPARIDNFGNEIKQSDNLANAFSPVRMSTERPEEAAAYNRMMGDKLTASEKKQAKDMLMNGGDLNDMDGKSPELAELGEAGNYIYAYDLEKYTKGNSESGIKRYTFEIDKAKVARDIMEGTATYKDLPDEIKPEIYKAMGLDQQDVEYDYMSNQPSDAVSQYLMEEMGAANLDHNAVIQALINGRRASISGKMMVANAVVDDLYKNGIISKTEATALKKVKLGKNGENQSAPASGGGSKKKKISALVTALKNVPKIGNYNMDSSQGKGGTDFNIPKPSQSDTNLETKVQKIAPISLEQIFAGSQSNPMTGTNISKAKAIVAGSGGGAPGTGLKLSKSFYRGR